jgi:hypothetical protein
LLARSLDLPAELAVQATAPVPPHMRAEFAACGAMPV